MSKHIICEDCIEYILSIQTNTNIGIKKSCLINNCIICNITFASNLFKITLSGSIYGNLIKAKYLANVEMNEAKWLVLTNIVNESSYETRIESTLSDILSSLELLIRKCEYFNLLE